MDGLTESNDKLQPTFPQYQLSNMLLYLRLRLRLKQHSERRLTLDLV